MESAEHLDRQQFAIVARTTAAIAAAGSIDEALNALLKGMAKLTGADLGGVRLLLEASAPYGACELYFWRAPNHSEWRRIETRVGSNTARVLATGQGEYSVDLGAAAKAGDSSAQLALTRDGILSSIIVPLHAAGLVIGTLHADARTAQAFSDAHIAPLQLLADHAGGVVEHVRQRSQAESRLRRLEAAQRMSAAVNAAGDLDALLHRLMQEVLETLDAQRGAVLLVDADGRFLRPRLTLGYPPGPFETIVRPLYRQADPQEDIYAMVVRTREQLVISATHPARYRPNKYGFPAAFRVLTPIAYGDEAIGVFSAVWTDREDASSEDLALLRLLAEQAGGAVARARLVEAEQLAQQRLLTALHNSGTITYSYDSAGRLDSVVGDVFELTGWTAEELLGQPVLMFSVKADQGTMEALVNGRLAGDTNVWQRETLLQHRSGQAVPVLAVGAPRLVGGRPGGGTGVVTDLRRMKQVQAELDRALAFQARAEGAVRTGRAVGHELGSPLGTIVGLTSLLLADARLPADVLEDLRTLSAEAERAGELLHRFAGLTRYEEMPTPVGPQLDVHRATDQARSGELPASEQAPDVRHGTLDR